MLLLPPISVPVDISMLNKSIHANGIWVHHVLAHHSTACNHGRVLRCYVWLKVIHWVEILRVLRVPDFVDVVGRNGGTAGTAGTLRA